jgi:predicted regulator of Ras-like GTPase activity (Roadblock/LC7/MglB family)
VSTAFTPILHQTLARTPGAVGAIFADADGEAVDHATQKLLKQDDLLVLGAHYGVLLGLVRRGLDRFHLGRVEEILFHHERLDVLIQDVGDGYYVVLAIESGSHLASARTGLSRCAALLKAEM